MRPVRGKSITIWENIQYPVRSLRNKLQTASDVEVASDLKPSNLGRNDFSKESVPQNEHN
jgi:hypothetical protein